VFLYVPGGQLAAEAVGAMLNEVINIKTAARADIFFG